MRIKTTTIFVFLVPVLMLLVFSFQYPFSVDVPIGGDAPSHIMNATNLKRFIKSPYPLSSLILSSTHILPWAWTTRFNFAMATGFALSGFVLAFFLNKIGGKTPAIIGMMFWSISAWDILPFFRDGTFAQLWSMPFLILFYWSAMKKRLHIMLLIIFLLYFLHPATFFVALLSLILSFPILATEFFNMSKSTSIILVIIFGFCITTLLFIFPTFFPYSQSPDNNTYLSYKDLIESRIGILTLLSLVGLFFFLTKKTNYYFKSLFITYLLISFFVSLNSLWGIGSWERRFFPYFAFVLIFLGSLGLADLLREFFPLKVVRITVFLFLMLPLCLNAWLVFKGYYRIFNTDRSAMRKTEQAAYEWLKNNTDKNSMVLQTLDRGRGVEWLPVIAKRNNFVVNYQPSNLDILKDCNYLITKNAKLGLTHALFYQWTEKIPDYIKNDDKLFPLVFKNSEVSIFELPISNNNKPTLTCP